MLVVLCIYSGRLGNNNLVLDKAGRLDLWCKKNQNVNNRLQFLSKENNSCLKLRDVNDIS